MQNTTTYNEPELLLRLAEGDESALTALYSQYWQPLYGAAFKRLKDSALAQDVVQEVFTDLWRRRGQTTIDNLSAYLHTAVQYQVYKLASRKKHIPQFLELFEHMSSSAYLAEYPLRQKELLALIAAWIETLPEKRRAIFKLHYVNNLGSDEIAAQLNISPKTVRNQLGTALEAFRTELARFLSILLM